MKAKYITIHSTGNPDSTAQNERDYLVNVANTRQASFHIVVDDKEAIECIPLNEVSWNAGDGYYGTGNRESISIEICESGDRQKTLDNAVNICHKIMREQGIIEIRRHYDWSGKICPRILSYDGWLGWQIFKKRVGELY